MRIIIIIIIIISHLSRAVNRKGQDNALKGNVAVQPIVCAFLDPTPTAGESNHSIGRRNGRKAD